MIRSRPRRDRRNQVLAQRPHLAVSPGSGVRAFARTAIIGGRGRRHRRRRPTSSCTRAARTASTRWTRSASGAWESAARLPRIGEPCRRTAAGAGGCRRRRRAGTRRQHGADGRWQALALSPTGEADAAVRRATVRRSPDGRWPTLDVARGPSIVAMPADSGGAADHLAPGSRPLPLRHGRAHRADRNGAQLRSNRSGIGTSLAARAGFALDRASPSLSRAVRAGAEPAAARDRHGRRAADRFRRDDLVRRRVSDRAGARARSRPRDRRDANVSCRVVRSCSRSTAGTSRSSPTCSASAAWARRRAPACTTRRARARACCCRTACSGRARHRPLALKITEPMEEVAYLDRGALVAYDLPPGWQMVLDERKAISPPEATGEPALLPRRAAASPAPSTMRRATSRSAIADGGRRGRAARAARPAIHRPAPTITSLTLRVRHARSTRARARRCSSPTAGSSIRTRRRSSPRGRPAPPTERRRSRRAARDGALARPPPRVRLSGRHAATDVRAARPLPRGTTGASASHEPGDLLGSPGRRLRRARADGDATGRCRSSAAPAVATGFRRPRD